MRVRLLLATLTTSAFVTAGLAGCHSPTPGPDKTVGGALLGAGWGAGAGAVIGNQVRGNSGEGAAIGAGFGLVEGGLIGFNQDVTEDAIAEQQNELDALKTQNLSNARQLETLQGQLDRTIARDNPSAVHQVFFDTDTSSLRSGNVANLEVIADSLKGSANGYWVNVIGHSDDSGNPEYNQRLAEARARTVASYLGARGLSLDRIKVRSFGSTRPVATNSTEIGRQLNRRVDLYLSKQ